MEMIRKAAMSWRSAVEYARNESGRVMTISRILLRSSEHNLEEYARLYLVVRYRDRCDAVDE